MAESAEPTNGGRPGRKRRVNPIVIVVGVAVVAFVIAFLAFRGGSKTTKVTAGGQISPPSTTATSGCPAGNADPAYTVTMESDPSPPRAEGTTFHLTVRHNGNAVTGATVCVSADMTEMHHEGITDTAKEVSNGKYDIALKFGMRGPYLASILITERGKPPVLATVNFQVN